MSYQWVFRGALLAAVAEFILLRVLLRLGPILPATPTTETIFRAVALGGTWALNAAVILGLVAVGLWVREARRRGWGLPEGAVGVTWVLLIAGSLASPTGPMVLWPAALALTALSFGVRNRYPPAVLAGLTYGAAAAASPPGLWPGPGFWTAMAEAGAVGLGLLFLARGSVREERAKLAAGLVAGLILTLGLFVAGWFVKAVGIWTVGLTFYLPAPLYGLALAGLVRELLSSHEPRRSGLLLMGLGGLRTDLSYFALLGLMGVLTWAGPRHESPLATGSHCPTFSLANTRAEHAGTRN